MRPGRNEPGGVSDAHQNKKIRIYKDSTHTDPWPPGINQRKNYTISQRRRPSIFEDSRIFQKATPLLKQLKQSARVPILTKSAHYYKTLKNPVAREMFMIDVLATNLYSLGIPEEQFKKGNRDFTEKIRII